MVGLYVDVDCTAFCSASLHLFKGAGNVSWWVGRYVETDMYYCFRKDSGFILWACRRTTAITRSGNQIMFICEDTMTQGTSQILSLQAIIVTRVIDACCVLRQPLELRQSSITFPLDHYESFQAGYAAACLVAANEISNRFGL